MDYTEVRLNILILTALYRTVSGENLAFKEKRFLSPIIIHVDSNLHVHVLSVCAFVVKVIFIVVSVRVQLICHDVM